MTPFDLAPFAPEHLDSFEPGAHEQKFLSERYLSILRSYWPGRAMCAIRDCKTLGIAGVSMIGTCAFPWMLLSDELRRCYPISLTKMARRFCAEIFASDGAACIEVGVDPNFSSARRWIERQGFSQIGLTQDSMRYVLHERDRTFHRERGNRGGLHDLRRQRPQ